MHSLAMKWGLFSRSTEIAVVLFAWCVLGLGQTERSDTHRSSSPDELQSTKAGDRSPQEELRIGTALTARGEFERAIPHLIAARVANDYAASFNLAICYVATNQPALAIPILNDLRSASHDNAEVNNLLAQAYVGDSQDQKALEALHRAADITPDNEKLYMFVADACMGKRAYALGLDVVSMGVQQLPNSARLHFERAMFLSLLDRFDEAKADFNLSRALAPNSHIAFVAGAQEAMLDGNVSEAIKFGREGVKHGDADFMLLTLLGEALLRSGAVPGRPEFEEAKAALEKAVTERANYPSSQLALGKLYLLDDRLSDAIAHLENARQLDPGNASVYSNLAVAYRKGGEISKAQDAIATLAKLNEARAEKIRAAPGDRRASHATTHDQDK